MQVFEAIKNRRSVRKYKSDQIPEKVLNKVLEAARLSPSAKNMQEWKFIVVKDREIKEQLVKACKNQKFVGEAPVVIIGIGIDTEYTMTCGLPAYIVDVSIAFSYLILQAYEEGLGTCWIGAFYEDQVKKILNIPEKYRVVAITPLGYPAENPEPRSRKPLKDIVCYEKWC